MSAQPDIAAIIAAGGTGTRFSTPAGESAKPKQFLHLRGLPLYAWSLLALARHQMITHIVIATPAALIDEIKQESKTLSDRDNLKPVISVIEGGKTRQDSVFHALQHLANSSTHPDFVLIHDAARPFLDTESVDVMIKAVIKYGACTVGGAVSDTIKRVANGKIIETLPRHELIAVQTPQAAGFDNLLQAHEEAALAGYSTTDDAALMEWAGHEVFIIEGPKYNPKITNPLDLMLAEALADYLNQDRL